MVSRAFFGAIFCAIACALVGCAGGGSEGTGIQGASRSIEGTIVSVDGSPIAQAQVTILETGESGISDAQGQFAIQTSSTEESLELEIEKGDDSVRTTVVFTAEESQVEAGSQGVQVTIQVGPDAAVASVESLEVSVKIVGECDVYFENNRTIRQSNPVPPGTRCTARIETRSNGNPLGNVPYGVRFRGCEDGSPGTQLAVGLTSVAFNPGVGQVVFPYVDDAAHCVYEFLVPYGQPDTKPVIYEILTFTKQSK